MDHFDWIFQQVLCVDRSKETLAGTEHDGHDVHAHLVDQARGKDLSADVARRHLDHAVTSQFPRLIQGGFHTVYKVERCVGIPALGSAPVGHDHDVFDTSWRCPVPAVRHVENTMGCS